MARPAKMRFRKQNRTWYVEIDGKQVNLGKDKNEATTRFHKLMAEKGQERPLLISEPLVCEVADRFLEWCTHHREQRTVDSYRHHWERFLKWLPRGKTLPASELKPYHIIEYLDAHTWGNSYKRQAAGAVQRAFRWAVSVGLFDFHSCVRIPKPKGERRETPMTAEQYQEILRHSRPEFRDVLEFAWETGCRPQEIRLLRPDYVQGDVVVFPIKESKGKRRSRVIYLNEKALAIIARQPKNDWVFVNARGNQWSASNFNNRLDRLKKKLGYKCCLYQARHAYGTRKLLEGHSVEIVSALMGHQSPQMLHAVYGHINQATEHLKRAAK
ncbi:MAG: tyrosine-type recombinase/integrase [Planctomycetales bacterium]|nr:tyrosine-type recombinase/integrase [Planctomycetales bacterium]